MHPRLPEPLTCMGYFLLPASRIQNNEVKQVLPIVGSTQWTSQGDKEAKLGQK